MANKIKPTEIRIFIKGGVVEQIGIGAEVPRTIILSFVDEDIEGVENDAIESNGYGEECVFSRFDGETLKGKRDDDGVLWL